MSEEFQQAFTEAAQLQTAGNYAAAEKAFISLLEKEEDQEAVHRALVDLYLQTQRPIEAIDSMKALVELRSDSLLYCDRLAALLVGLGQIGTAIFHYQQFLQRQPRNANAYFNIALLYKKGKRYVEAEATYEQAIALGIDGLEEVYSNMGVMYSEMRQSEKAREMYERALQTKADYIPALFNLAGLTEEAGKAEEAKALYEQILLFNPRHWESLSRLAHAKKIDSTDSQLMESLQKASQQANDDLLGKESIYFALGKAFDDLEQYENAFDAYTEANKIGKLRNPDYQRTEIEKTFEELIETFSDDWIRSACGSSDVSPIFICGMFRSGSTLVEQVLSAHESITAGGELDYLQWLVGQRLLPFPQRMRTASELELQKVGEQYLSLVHTLFPGAQCVTDKQPDNFVYLGLIKILYPSARIIYTKRNPLDNCLSVNFQQLGGNLSYATNLEDTAHYYKQHQGLMNHWIKCFPDNVHTVDYDELVRSPEPVLRDLLAFLQLEWDEKCLAFQESKNPVKTASVWQVREELHTRSSGRWRNYEAFVQNIQGLLD
jgi:tetratricopeptide (TPR) repeat protein